MSGYVKHHGTSARTRMVDVRRFLWVISAAVLCGLGLLAVLFAVILFAGGLFNWAWWLGIIPLVGGFFMLLDPRSGPQSGE